MIGMDDEAQRALDYRRTKKATAKLNRQREAKAADLLMERGWTGLTTPQGRPWPDAAYVERDPQERA